MTPKERMHAVLEGKPVDRMPVTVSYAQLYHQDHFGELTGSPRHHYRRWVYSPLPELTATMRRLHEAAPFDVLQLPSLPSARDRARVEFVERDGGAWLHDKDSDAWTPVAGESKSGHGGDDYVASEKRLVFEADDVERAIPVEPAEAQIARGDVGAYRELARAVGSTEFVMTGGVVGTIYSAGQYFGQTELLASLIENPGLVEQVCRRITDRNVETIRALASAGGDAIYIDDATATSEMISPAMYEQFSLPYMRRMVEEIHRLGHKALIIYFGGVMDRLDQIASVGADGLAVEASMKGYVNDIGAIARQIGDRVTLYANLNPYDHIQRLPESALAEVMRKQAEAVRGCRGFVMASASPITMKTPLDRIRWFIGHARTLPPARRQ
jgi:uroporphyrinogen decarboxylase